MLIKNDYNAKSYFLWTFFVTFFFWFIGAYFSFTKQDSYMSYMFLGLITPFVVSFIMLSKSKKQGALRLFIDKLINLKRINIKLLPFMILLMPISIVLSIVLSTLFGGSFAQFTWADSFSFSTGFVPVFFLLLFAATFEELGWRGYAFESLASRFNYFYASLIFSLLWSAWHLPLVFVNNSYQYEVLQENIWYAINFYASIIPMGIIISWLCIKNKSSIFVAILFHLFINLSQEALMITQLTKSIQTFVLALITLCIIFLDKELFFKSRKDA